MPGDAKLLTQAEYARSRKARSLPGGSREAVRKAVDDGRISAFGPDKQIDEQLADAQWERNTRARQSPEASGTPPAPAPVPAADPAARDPGASSSSPHYNESRARRERAEAEIAEMSARKQRGELVAWEDVARGGFEVGRELRDTMESAVNALAAELADLSSADRCADVLRRHNRTIQDALVRAWRAKIGPAPAGGLGE